MNRVTARLLFFVILILISSKSIFAYDPNATGSAVVSATISGLNAPILIAPRDNSATKNPREQISWKRPSPLFVSPLHHYDVYLDGQVFAASVSDSITTTLTYYFYTVKRDDDIFYLDFNTDLAQGYHTWRSVVYNDAGTNAATGTWTYYIDSVTPFITLKKVDRQTLNWSTADSNTIPDVNHRNLTVTTANPLLTGKVEPFANMQITLQNQTYQGNYPSGDWQHRFYNLTRGLTYTVYITATDAGGNSVTLPEFYLQYGTPAPTPTTSEPSPSPKIIIPPIPFSPPPPSPMPTPPTFLTASPVQPLKIENLLIENWKLEIILLVIGLPSHLIMSILGAKIHFTNTFRFLFTLFFPFLGHKTLQTLPFCTLEIFHPDQIDSTHQTVISDINGKFSLKEPLPDSLFVKITCVGRVFKNTILSKTLFRNICLFPRLETPQTPSNRLRQRFMTYRSLPLAVACITSGLALTFLPNYFFLIYLYLSLQLVFSEYIYPRLSK